MLQAVAIENFRSLERVELPLAPLTALVGPNGAGKTSILRAIDLVLGSSWPSLRSFRIPQDFTNFDTGRDLAITVVFGSRYVHRDTLGTERDIAALRLRCRPYRRSGKWGAAGDLHVDLEPLDQKGEVPLVAAEPLKSGAKPTFRPLLVGSDLRDHGRALFVDHRRSLLQHLPTTRGSILGRLLEPARKAFDRGAEFRDAYGAAMEILRTDPVKEVEARIADTAKRMLGFLGASATAGIEIGFGFSDPANPFSSLRLQFKEGGLEVPGEELGLGIQSAMVIGVFDTFRQLGEVAGTVIIEEPEMYLHPQAQRYFYRLLREMSGSGECQVIYSTHSPIFADVSEFESLRLVRKSPGEASMVSFVPPADLPTLEEYRRNQKLSGQFDAATSEVLFAKEALLVEGHADRVAAHWVAQSLPLDLDAEGLAVVDCGGKNGIPLVAKVCRALGIPVSVLHDEDVVPLEGVEDQAKSAAENDAAERANERIRTALQDDPRLFVARPSLEAELGIGANARDKPRRVLEVLGGLGLARAPEVLTRAVGSLSSMDRGGGTAPNSIGAG